MKPTPTKTPDQRIHYGYHLSAQGYYHAAIEVWECIARSTNLSPQVTAQACDQIGYSLIQLGNTDDAITWFEQAVNCEVADTDSIKYVMHLALAYDDIGDGERAERLLTSLLSQCDGVPLEIRAKVHANVSTVMYHNQHYHEAIRHCELGIAYFEQIHQTKHIPTLYNNLACAHLELMQLDTAESYLKAYFAYTKGKHLFNVSELCRLHFKKGELAESITYANMSLDFVWSSIINYEKDELAHLCHLLAQLSFAIGERSLALRLLEKAQIYFGQISNWRKWASIDEMMETWLSSKLATHIDLASTRLDEIRRFLTLLDVMNAQELLHPNWLHLLDVRTQYACALARSYNFSASDIDALVYACRFADFGLTAMEAEVIAEPRRSKSAWQQYEQHPHLSVQMLQWIKLHPVAIEIIEQHHEHFDGTGYPKQLLGNEISTLSAIFTVANTYAMAVVVESQKHTVALATIQSARGTILQPDLVDAFLKLFDSDHH